MFTGLFGYENKIHYKAGKCIKTCLINLLGKYKIETYWNLKTYVTFQFVPFSSKQLIFVYKHTLSTERLATVDFSVNALTYKSIYYFSPQYQAKWSTEKSLVKS